jgi:hypothetical protein
MQGRKKSRLASVLQAAGLSIPLNVVSRVARELAAESGDDDILTHNIDREMKRLVHDVVTPFGSVVKHLRVPCKSSGHLDFPICCPFALIYWLCSTSSKFGDFLREHLEGKVNSVCIWADETTSGNQHRSDNRRTFMSFYWTLCELPAYYRNTDHGWFPLGVLSVDSVKNVDGEASAVLKYLMRFMFLGEHNFATGVRFGQAGREFIIRGRFAALLQDEKGIKQSIAVKGASGSRCCLMCRNVLNCDLDKVRVQTLIRCLVCSLFAVVRGPAPTSVQLSNLVCFGCAAALEICETKQPRSLPASRFAMVA